MKEYSITVDAQHIQQRLDVFLTEVLPDVPSRTFVQSLIENGDVLVDQKAVKSHHRVSEGEVVTARVPQEEALWNDLKPEKIELDIFYEDAWILVLNKPVGLLVHPTHGVNSGTLVNALLHYCQNLSDVNETFRPGIVHRLDRETSGLMVVAKDNLTHVALARQFEQHEIRKKYVALVMGTIDFDEGVVDAPLGRHYRHFDKKMVSFEEDAKEARTFYRVVRRFSNKATLVALYPESGRTHQLRVHMAHVGHSILGDDKYGQKETFPRLALHAQSLGFVHPKTKAFVEFSSAIPEEFLNFRLG